MLKIKLLLGTIVLIAWSLSASLALADKHDSHGEKDHCDTKINGVVEKMPEKGREGIWVIGGQEIQVDKSTKIREKHGPIAIGSAVEVKGHQSDKRLTADEIEPDHDRKDHAGKTCAKFYGTVTQMPKEGTVGTWVVNDREIVISKDTKVGEKYGKAIVGSYVEVEGDFSGSAFTAYRIEVKRKKSEEHDHSHKHHERLL